MPGQYTDGEGYEMESFSFPSVIADPVSQESWRTDPFTAQNPMPDFPCREDDRA